MQRARRSLEYTLRRPVTLAELATEVELPEVNVSEVLRVAVEPRSLSEPLREDGDVELGDIIQDDASPAPHDAAALELLVLNVSILLTELDERERRIISLRFGFDRGEPCTLKEIGKHFNVTHERIRQIEARALAKLRRHADDETVRSLLDA